MTASPPPADALREQRIRNEYYDLGFEDGMKAAAAPAPGLDVEQAVDALENVLTSHDWIGTRSSQEWADKDEREAWRQWDVIRAALGLPPAEVYDWQTDAILRATEGKQP